MKRPWTIVLVLVIVLAAVAGGDQIARVYLQNRTADEIEARYGGAADVRLGGWPFVLAALTRRLPDAHATITGAQVANEGKKATVEVIDVTIKGLSPITELDDATAEQVDATATISWNQLSVLLGFPIERAGDGRIEVRTSVQVLQRVIPLVLQTDLTLQSDGTLVLNNPGISVADFDLPLPSGILQLAIDQLTPDLKLPTPGGLSYQSLDIGQNSVTIQLTGQDIALSDFR